MTKLTDTQITVLTVALNRPGLRVLPLPATLRGGAGAKVVNALMAKGLVAEVAPDPDDPIWRGDGAATVTLVATEAAFTALGREPHSAPERAAGGHVAQDLPVKVPTAEAACEAATGPVAGRASEGVPNTPAPRTRAGTKQAKMLEMLRSGEGANIAEIAAANSWELHTVRGAIAGALKRRLGIEFTSEVIEGRGRVYRAG